MVCFSPWSLLHLELIFVFDMKQRLIFTCMDNHLSEHQLWGICPPPPIYDAASTTCRFSIPVGLFLGFPQGPTGHPRANIPIILITRALYLNLEILQVWRFLKFHLNSHFQIQIISKIFRLHTVNNYLNFGPKNNTYTLSLHFTCEVL